MATPSILGVLGNPEEDLAKQQAADQQRAIQMGQLDPDQLFRTAAYSGGAMIGKGLGQAVGGVTGAPTGTPVEQKAAAIQRVKDKLKAQGVDASDLDKFYPALIKALGEEGLVAEAAQAAQEFQMQTRANRKSDLEDRKLGRQEHADSLKDETERLRIEAMREKVGPRADKLVQYIDAYNSATDQNTKAMYKQAIDNMAAGKGVMSVVANGLIEIRDRQTGKLIGSTQTQKQENPTAVKKAAANVEAVEAARERTVAALEQTKTAATELLNHKGLSSFIGVNTGAAADPKDPLYQTMLRVIGGEGQSALAVYNNVVARGFLDTIMALKAAGKGSTGLGAVSDTEGKRLVDSLQALSPRQPVASFKPQLQKHIANLTQAIDAINAEVDKYKNAPDSVAPAAPATPAAAAPAFPAMTPPPAAPAAPAAPAGRQSLADIWK